MARRLPSLGRRPPSREPKRRFIVFCEGGKTEPAYLKAMQRHYGAAIIEIKIHPAVGDPLAIARAAAERIRQDRQDVRRDSYTDQVWAVFDRDRHERFGAAIALCESRRVHVARSNPCFELWLILHHQDFDGPDDSRAVQRRYEDLDPSYVAAAGKTPNCHSLMPRIEDAERRAFRQLQVRAAEREPFGKPSTTVGDLTTAIRTAAEASAPKSQPTAGDKAGPGAGRRK